MVLINEIIIIIPQWLNRRDFNRFGIDCMRSRGYTVKIWDVGWIVFPELMKIVPSDVLEIENCLVQFKSIKSFKKSVKNLNKQSVVLSFTGKTKITSRLHKIILRSDAYLGFVHTNCLPRPIQAANSENLKESCDDIKIICFLKIIAKFLLSNCQKQYLNLLALFKGNLLLKLFDGSSCEDIAPHFIVAGGEKSLIGSGFNASNTQVIYAHAMDFDLYLKSGVGPNLQNIIVMLDENMAFHPEYSLYGITPPSAKEYYDKLNCFFGYLEELTGWKVVIAGHPRTQPGQLEPFLKGREIIFGDTCNLVRNANLVIGHASTSFGFCILYKKPALFFTFSHIDHEIGMLARTMALLYGKNIVNIDFNVDLNLDEILSVDLVLYEKYRSAYIKKPGTPNKLLFDIFIDKMEQILFLNKAAC